MSKIVYIGAVSDKVREDILVALEQLMRKTTTNRIEEADIIILEDGWYKHPALRAAFEFGLKKDVRIIHYKPEQTREFLFGIALDHLEKFGRLHLVLSRSRSHKRENVIYRSAVCAFLLKCGLPPEIVAPFVNRDRSLMYHYAKLHKAEMITTPLYKTVYTSLMRKVL